MACSFSPFFFCPGHEWNKKKIYYRNKRKVRGSRAVDVTENDHQIKKKEKQGNIVTIVILIRTHSIDLRISENLLEREQSLSAIVQTMKSVVTISIPAIDCVFVLFLLFFCPISFLRRFVSYDQGGGASSCFPGLRLAAVVLSISSRFSPFLFWFYSSSKQKRHGQRRLRP